MVDDNNVKTTRLMSKLETFCPSLSPFFYFYINSRSITRRPHTKFFKRINSPQLLFISFLVFFVFSCLPPIEHCLACALHRFLNTSRSPSSFFIVIVMYLIFFDIFLPPFSFSFSFSLTFRYYYFPPNTLASVKSLQRHQPRPGRHIRIEIDRRSLQQFSPPHHHYHNARARLNSHRAAPYIIIVPMYLYTTTRCAQCGYENENGTKSMTECVSQSAYMGVVTWKGRPLRGEHIAAVIEKKKNEISIFEYPLLCVSCCVHDGTILQIYRPPPALGNKRLCFNVPPIDTFTNALMSLSP